MGQRYNWWEDPKNKEEIEKISWWNHAENKEDYSFPISVIQSGDVWVASCNDETRLLMGDSFNGCAQGDTKADAIEKMFKIFKISQEYSQELVFRYQRWIPFRKGNWKYTGGKWFVVFGIHVYFRYGKKMKGGWYIPFTKLNVSVYSEWSIYRNYLKKKKTINL
jgi:hypothetical protein